jgi:hypothetical protein
MTANANSDYMFYKALFCGNYVKGANALRGMMRNQGQAGEVASSEAALSVIFETPKFGGRQLLPTAFFDGLFKAGQGLRNFARLEQPNFDDAGALATLDTASAIAASSTAMTAIAASSAAMAAILASDTAIARITANSTAMTAIAASATAMAAIAARLDTRTAIVNSTTAKTAINNSPLMTTAYFSNSSINSWQTLRQGMVWINTVRSNAGSSQNYLGNGTLLPPPSQTQICPYGNTEVTVNCFSNGISLMSNNSNYLTHTVRFMPIES